MRYRTRARLITLAVLMAASGGALAWWYPSWRTSRDLRSAEQSLAAYDFPGACELLARCEARRPNDPEIQLLACRAARRAGDLTAAEQHYARYRQLVEGSQPNALLERALIDAQSGRVDEVRPYLLTCLDVKHPRSEEILEALAVGSVGFYNFEQTQLWIEKLLALAPANPIGRLNKANTFTTLGRMDEAIAILRDLVRDYPQNVEAKLSLAALLATTNANEEAAKVFTDAHRLAPNESRALAGLARVLLRNNRLDDFRALAPELEQRNDDSQALLYLGRFAVLERRWADGERYLNRAVQLAPYDMEIHRDLSVCLYQMGRREDADRHAKRSR
jgi:Flp pilus assembly protein TadD